MKRGILRGLQALALSTTLAGYGKMAHADEARIPLTETLQLRLSDDNLPATMDSEGRMKIARLGLDLELKLQEWLVPYVRGESGAFDYGDGFGISSRRGSFPQSQPAAGLEVGAGLRIPLYENKEERTRLDADVHCSVNSLAGEYCFAGLRYGF